MRPMRKKTPLSVGASSRSASSTVSASGQRSSLMRTDAFSNLASGLAGSALIAPCGRPGTVGASRGG